MEGLRGLAVFLVFIVHYTAMVKPWFADNSVLQVIASAMHVIGNAGVDLFFVLSGYLIYGSLISRPQRFASYMSRRIKRIYPAFVAVFAIYVVLSFVLPAQSKMPSPASDRMIYLTENFLLLPGLFPIEPMITVAWSLSYEMFYYFAIPIVITLLGLRFRSTIWRVSFFATLAAAALIYHAVFEVRCVQLVMFVSGILLYESTRVSSIRTPNSFVGLMALAFGLLATLLPLDGSSGSALKTGIRFASFLVLCLACFRDPFGWLAVAFSWKPGRWLGNMSYSYYLLHGLVLKGVFLALAVVLPIGHYDSWLFWALLPAMFAVTLIPTAVLFLAVERPFSLSPPRGRRSETPEGPRAGLGEKARGEQLLKTVL